MDKDGNDKEICKSNDCINSIKYEIKQLIVWNGNFHLPANRSWGETDMEAEQPQSFHYQ